MKLNTGSTDITGDITTKRIRIWTKGSYCFVFSEWCGNGGMIASMINSNDCCILSMQFSAMLKFDASVVEGYISVSITRLSIVCANSAAGCVIEISMLYKALYVNIFILSIFCASWVLWLRDSIMYAAAIPRIAGIL